MSTEVVNVRVKYIRPEYDNLEEWTKDPINVYIGRRGVVFVGKRENKKRFPQRDSLFANPFKVGKDGTREEVIQKYREYIYQQLNKGKITKEDIKSLKGKKLGCWCYPEECHGNVLVEILENLEIESSK